MEPVKMLWLAIERGLAVVETEVDLDDHDGCNDIDLDTAEVDDDGFLVESGLFVDYVRDYQAGDISHFNHALYVTRPGCDRCGHGGERHLVASFSSTSRHADPDDGVLHELATQGLDELKAILA